MVRTALAGSALLTVLPPRFAVGQSCNVIATVLADVDADLANVSLQTQAVLVVVRGTSTSSTASRHGHVVTQLAGTSLRCVKVILHARTGSGGSRRQLGPSATAVPARPRQCG